MNNAGGWDNTGSSARTITLGSATYTLSAAAATWGTVAGGLTQSSSSANIAFTGTTGNRQFTSGGKTYGSLTVGATSTSPGSGVVTISGGGGTLSSLSIAAPNWVRFQTSDSITITSLTCAGSSSNQILLSSNSPTQAATPAVTTATMAWTAFLDLTFTGSPSATNSFNLGNLTGITITAPGGGGGGGGIIGS